MFFEGNLEGPAPLTRRRLLTGAVAAAGSVLVADGCSSTGVGVLAPGMLGEGTQYTLTVGYTNSVIGGRRFRTRTYNGATVGPTIVAKPGTTLNVNVVNALPPNPTEVVPASAICWPPGYTNARHLGTAVRAQAPLPAMQIDAMNNPHKFNTTNLHVHGIQTIPHIFFPIGTSSATAQQLAIEPGSSFQYSLPIAPDQPCGLHWYHPHHHGSTDVQVSGGMAGLIIVPGPIDQVPEIAAARDIHMAIQTIRVNKSATDPTLYVLEPTAYQPPPPYGNGFQLTPNYAMVTVNGQGVCWIDNTQNTSAPVPGVYEPLPVPQYTLQPGEVVRLRILNGSNSMQFPLVIPGMNVYVIGRDGINFPAPALLNQTGTQLVTPANMFDGTTIDFPMGSRVEMLVQAPQTPGTYTLRAVALGGGDNYPSFDFAQFVVGGAPLNMTIPASLPLPTREYPAIADAEITAYHTVTFSMGTSASILTGLAFYVNDQSYDEAHIDTYPSLGTAQEWTLINTSTIEGFSDAHPFHIHVNSFEVTALNGVPLATPEFRDTMTVPPAPAGGTTSITIRIRFKEFCGKTLYHCHFLGHEDTGMMQNILIA